MTSEIRANTLKNRVGLGTVSFTNTGTIVSGIVTASEGVFIPDSKKIELGNTKASPDFEIFHNTSLDYNEIKSNNGNIRIRNHDTDNSRKHLYLQSEIVQLRTHTNNHLMISAYGGAQTELYYANNKKFETTNTGAKVTGKLGVGTDSPTDPLHVYHASDNFVGRFESGDAGGGIVLKDPTHSTTLITNDGDFTINVDNGSDITGETIKFEMSGSEKVRINSDRVIIGQDLSNNQPTYNTSTTFVTTHTNNPGAWNAIAIISGNSTGASFLKFGDTNDEDVSQIGHYNVDNSLRFFTNGGNERLRIDSNGRTLFSRGGLTESRNVGTKTGEIQVASSGNSSAITIIGYSNDVGGPHLVFGKSRAGNATGSTILQSGDRLGEIAFCGADGTDIDSFGAAIKAHVDGTPGSNDMPGRLEFYTTSDGGSSAVERVRITSAGKVGINDSSPTEMLDVGGAVQASQGFKTAGHPVVTYASFTDISGGSYATRLGSTGTSTLRHTQIYTGGSHQATFDGVNNRLGLRTTKPQTTFNVIGTISTGRNVARELGTVINVSSSHHATRAGSNVINGKKNYENQGSDWLTQGNARNNANLTIDLGSSISCDRFVIYNQNEYQNSHREVKNFTLEGSNDNSSWTTVLDDNAGCSNAHEPNPGWSFRMPADRDDDEEGVSYRYWRFTMKDFHGSDPYGGVMELELYETSNTNGEVESEVSTHSLVATDVSAEIVRANGQPAFCVARSSTQNISANQAIIFDDDSGNGYFQTGTSPHAQYFNTSTGIFTAPMSGIYFFTTTVLVQNSTGNYDLIIKTTGRDFYCAPGRKASNPGSTSWSTSGTVYLAFGGEVITYLKKGETAEVRFTTFGGGQIYGSGSWTRFAGYLLG